MGFASLKEVVDADIAGRALIRSWRKNPTSTGGSGIWQDLSVAPGHPIPQYYAASPLTATALRRSTDIGIDHGPAVSPSTKHLRKMTIMGNTTTGLPLTAILCDYLMFYPFVDEGTLDLQPMNNTVTLPRYADGAGVQVFAVSQAERSNGITFNFTYTNSAGVAGRTSQTVFTNLNSRTGNLITSFQGQANAGYRAPFIGLADRDTGVRSIESVQMISGTDVGLFALVLVKPLAQLSLREQTAPVEVDYLKDFNQMPVIVDDAFLNLIVCPQSALNIMALHGLIETTWS